MCGRKLILRLPLVQAVGRAAGEDGEGCAQVVLYHIKGEARPGSTSCVRCRCFIALSNLCYFVSQNSAF